MSGNRENVIALAMWVGLGRVWIERKGAGHYVAMASGPDGSYYPDGAAVDADTPDGALRALAARLSESTGSEGPR